MRALVTGGAGFAGTELVRLAQTAGDAVMVTVRAVGQAGDTAFDASVSVVPWDMSQGRTIEDEVAGAIRSFDPTVIYHLAAISVPADCGQREPTAEAMATNVEATAAVIELAAKLPSRPRVIFTSSCHVYGPGDSTLLPVDESRLASPVTPYGRTKLAAEAIASELAAQHGVELVIARAFHHTGPNQRPRFMLPEWVEQVVAWPDQPLRVRTRSAWLDLADVRDIARAYRRLAEITLPEPIRIYNVASGRAVQSGDVLEALLAASGFESDVIETHSGSRYEPIADISRLVRETGWQPRIPLDVTIRDMLAARREALPRHASLAIRDR